MGTAAFEGLANVPKLQFVAQLHPGDEEENREESVGGPGRQGQVQVQCLRADYCVGDREVGIPPGAVRPHEGDRRRGQQQHAADGLVAQGPENPLPLGQRKSTEQAIARSVR
ncbi:MAG: hypothetical protein V9E98_13425 [Candidatus Nanopelagicales bacterium]